MPICVYIPPSLVYNYQTLTLSFSQNSPVTPFISPRASSTGVFAPCSGLLGAAWLVISVLTQPGHSALIKIPLFSLAYTFVMAMTPILLTAYVFWGHPCVL